MSFSVERAAPAPAIAGKPGAPSGAGCPSGRKPCASRACWPDVISIAVSCMPSGWVMIRA